MAWRLAWLEKLNVPSNFLLLSQNSKLGLVLNNHNNVKTTAQYIINIFDKRSKIVSNLPSTNNSLFHIEPQDQCPACNPSV